jgi:hypothetical protein
MPIVTNYQSASGPSYRDCCFIGQRYEHEDGFSPGDSECWLMSARVVDGKTVVRNQYGAARWFTGLWRSPSGAVYVADAEGEVHVNPSPNALDSNTTWTVHPFTTVIMGVWGLDAAFVYAWGSTPQTGFHVFQWDGRRWQDLPTPGFEVVALHGAAPDLIYAVGAMGAIAHWNGRAWRRVASPVNEELVSVFVVSGDEQYATGNRGSLLEGSASGWGKIASGPSSDWPLHDVAKWNGELWIAAGPFGLMRRVGISSDLEVVKPNLRATALDARQDLVVTCDDMIAGTGDGKDFRAAAKDSLKQARAGKPLLDFT